MSKLQKLNKFSLIGIIIAGALFWNSFFVLEEGYQAVITQFGKPVGSPITDAGFHFKVPFIHKVNIFDKKLLKWDGDPNQIPTRDKKYIWVDTTARWRIKDPLKFLQTVATEMGAQSRLDDIIDSVVRDMVSSHLLVDLVRSANWKPKPELDKSEILQLGELYTQSPSSNIGREYISKKITEEAAKLTPQYGIELVDVLIKRINYVESVQKKVFDRMISERKRIASKYRSEGEGKRAEIMGEMVKELKRIESEAYKKAQEIRGKADAEATRIYADAFNKDPEFFAFIKSLEQYTEYPNKNTHLVISTEGEFFKYLKEIPKEEIQ